MPATPFNLKQLDALVWVADLGSFRKAAQHLNTTQPNISSRIAALEASLGCVLMQRDAGSVRMTDKGEEVLAQARNVLREAEKLVETAGKTDVMEDRLRLGVTELVACTWLHAYLRKLKEAYPALAVELTVDLSRNLDKELTSNALDLAIQTAPFGSTASGEIALGDFAYVWVGAPELCADLTGTQTLADLLPRTILTHARHTQAFGELMAHAEAKGLPTARVVPSSSMASCVQMAEDKMGIALLPEALVARDISDGRLSRVTVDWTPSPLRFAARFHAKRSARFVARAAEMALEVVRRE